MVNFPTPPPDPSESDRVWLRASNLAEDRSIVGCLHGRRLGRELQELLDADLGQPGELLGVAVAVDQAVQWLRFARSLVKRAKKYQRKQPRGA